MKRGRREMGESINKSAKYTGKERERMVYAHIVKVYRTRMQIMREMVSFLIHYRRNPPESVPRAVKINGG